MAEAVADIRDVRSVGAPRSADDPAASPRPWRNAEQMVDEPSRQPARTGLATAEDVRAIVISTHREGNDFKRETARSCTLISSYAFVDPRGRLYPCLTLDMGNVFEQPFEDVWNGRKFRAFRRLLRREQRLPLCERCPA